MLSIQSSIGPAMIKVSRAFVKAKFSSLMAAKLLMSVTMFISTPHAHADWRKEMGVFRIGIATQNGQSFNAEALDAFRSEISAALAMPVEIFQARNTSALIDAAASSRLEYAILSALGFVTLDLTCDCAMPIAAPTSAEGATAVRSVLYVNSDKVTSLQELTGKRLAVGSDNSLTGSILPFAQFSLNGAGLREADIELVRVASIEQAVEALAAGSVDGFFGWDQFSPKSSVEFESSLSKKLESYSDLSTETVWVSEPIRFGPHIIHKSVPAEAAKSLKEVLVSLDQVAPLAYRTISPDLSGGLKPVTAQDYISAFSLIRSISRDTNVEQTESDISVAQ